MYDILLAIATGPFRWAVKFFGEDCLGWPENVIFGSISGADGRTLRVYLRCETMATGVSWLLAKMSLWWRFSDPETERLRCFAPGTEIDSPGLLPRDADALYDKAKANADWYARSIYNGPFGGLFYNCADPDVTSAERLRQRQLNQLGGCLDRMLGHQRIMALPEVEAVFVR